MALSSLRRRGAPIGILCVASHMLMLLPPRTARGEESDVRPGDDTRLVVDTGSHEPTVSRHAIKALREQFASDGQNVTAPVGGGDHTGVSSQAISVPQGAGKIQGMGESFSTQISTGVATYSVPFALPRARGAVQPSLSLSYSSSAGHGVAGVGWDVGWPSISRQTDRGTPKYDDRAAWHPEQDRFVFNGGQELVPVCSVANGACADAVAPLPPGEQLPAWADGWQYFRARVEGSYLRFLWSQDHKTWVVQSKSGASMELGLPQDGSAYSGALEADPSNASHVFRWNLARQYDAQRDGSNNPVNAVVYRYLALGGTSYLSDIFDTSPASYPGTNALAQFAHHTHLVYDTRPDATFSYRRGWRVDQSLRLVGVDVVSKSTAAGAVTTERELVRRYHLTYDGSYHASLLASVQLEGRCPQTIKEDAFEQRLPAVTGCPALPALTFGYQHVSPFATDNSPGASDLPGFEGFDARLHTIAKSPPRSLDDQLTMPFDVNADGLPDVVATAPGLYNGKHAAFINGGGGKPDEFGDTFAPMSVHGVVGEDENIIKLSNPNIALHDIDGDGVVDLLHMPKTKTYSVYAPAASGTSFVWQGRVIQTASQQSPKIDLAGHNPAIKVMDVNGDGAVDVVFSSGTEYQTFFSLSRYPKGDAQFGFATWQSATSASIHNDPVSSCLPWSATPALLSDDDVRVADMNGDGLPDIVRVRAGDVRYWPGRGNGYWGTGDPNACPAGSFGQNQHITMSNGPQIGVTAGESLLVDDVNGDGLDDLVKVHFNSVDVWLNVDGASWTARHIIIDTPLRPAATDRVRLIDINGSGTRDLLWGDGGNYRYIDLLGGQRPWVLTHVDNGLGKTTDIEYSTSTAMMLADQAARREWTSKAPMPIHVVSRVTERDNLQIVGRPAGAYVTEYSYREAVYDGRQREFRGFRSATARRAGDSNSPSATTTSTFLLGECADDEPPPAGLPSSWSRCTPDGRWADNPREALKGLPFVSETFDDNGVYLSTQHHTYTLRKLYTGLDGREVRVAFESASDSWAYDTAPFVKSESLANPTDVSLELTPGSPQADVVAPAKVTLRASAGRAHMRASSTVDAFGNALTQTAAGCVDGCAAPDDTIVTTTVPGRPPGDATGWLWRTVESYVQGNDGVARKHTISAYDLHGNPTQTSAVLNGTLPLVRFHEDPSKQTASPPPLASVDRTFVVSSTTYDNFGNAIVQTAPNGRYREIAYASDYADLSIAETVYVGAVSGTRGTVPLTATATYDRGLGTVVAVRDLHFELTTVIYDGFGRLSSLSKPSSTTIGASSGKPSVAIDYQLASSGQPFSIVHTRTQDGANEEFDSYRDAYAYVDGFGRAIVTLDQADPTAGDGGQWVVNGLTDYDNKGAARRAFLAWFWTGDPRHYPLSAAPATSYSRQRYDAFGRQVQTFGLDGIVTLQSAYHALGADKWDAADLENGPHQGTYASALNDGHGRAVSVTERIRVGGQIEQRQTLTQFQSTGEPIVIARQRGNDQVVRWLKYDTLGRMVLNVEPNTTSGFNASPKTNPDDMKAWRYAYDDNGDLVGTSDARGCGVNYHYDAGGRIVAEDFSPCTNTQQDHSTPNLANGDGAEVFYRYDAADPTAPTTIDDCSINDKLLLGRLVSVSDRASKTMTSFDGRGRATCVARQIAKPGAPDAAIASRYEPRWYTQTVTYDGADRPVQASTGARVQVAPTTNQSFVTTYYTKRGTVKSVGSSYGALVANVTHDADGLVQQIVYGDAASTTTAFSYDQRRRLSSVQTYRGPPALWTAQPAPYSPAPNPNGAPSTFQLLLEDYDYAYDAVDNPTEIRDWRNASDWPAGAKPVTRKMQYDDLYRVTKIDYQYATGDDAWVDPFAAEDNGGATDVRRGKPSPHLSFAKRVMSQSFQYDWLGNTTGTDDDAKGFYDRSLGTITNGTAGAGPYQLKTAGGGAAPRDGSLTTAYDDAGNLIGLSVIRNATAPCSPSAAPCSQRFAYEWDEVGRLIRARRWDGAGLGVASDPIPTAVVAAELRYAYDGADDRVLKTAVDTEGNQLYTAYVFNSLELRRTTFDGTYYARNAWTEVPYLFAHGAQLARVHYATSDVPTLSSGQLHVFLELPDHLGSSAIVIDRESSELVERSTYQAYGSAESDYRPERWGAYREDYRFTGKEEDVEVGLQYFGKRYYAPAIGRWVSADPLTIHQLGSDLNDYAYVVGRALRATDPFGLACGDNESCEDASGNAITPGVWSTEVLNANDAKAQNQNPSRSTVDPAPAGGASYPYSPSPGLPSGPTQTTGEYSPFPSYAPMNLDEPDITAGMAKWNKAPSTPQYNPDAYGLVAQARPPTRVFTLTEGQKQDANIQAIGTLTLIFAGELAAATSPEVLAANGIDVPELEIGNGATATADGATAQCPGCKMCFAPGTLVLLGDRSTKRIEDIEVGDFVMSDDPEDSSPPEPQAVEAVYKTATKRLFRIRAGGGEILATAQHPFWTSRGWVPAERLIESDLLTNADGEQVRIGSIEIQWTYSPTYNFSVRKHHTYFVVSGTQALLVHNQHQLSFTVVDVNGNTRVLGNLLSAPMTPSESALGYPKSVMAAHTEARLIRTVPLQPGETLNMEGRLPPCNNCKGAMNALTRNVPGTTANYNWIDESSGQLKSWSSAGGRGSICP